jgi:hypothetical protein
VRERLVSLGLALAALALFWVLFFPKPGLEREAVSRPLSTDAGPAGYLGLMRWLDAEHFHAAAWRRRYQRLGATPSLPKSGNVLVTTLPHVTPARAAEVDALNAWIARGNAVVVLAALDDTPRWALGDGLAMIDELKRLVGIEFKTEEQLAAERAKAAKTAAARAANDAAASRAAQPPVTHDAPANDDGSPDPGAAGARDAASAGAAQSGRVAAAIAAVGAPGDVPLRPVAGHPLLTGARELATTSELPASRWLAQALDESPLLVLMRRADTGQPALWLKARGQGRLLVSAYASPFGNGLLGEAGNARLLANLIAGWLGPDGQVLVDDGHLGASDEYDPSAFYRDPRLHRTLLWVVVVWLLFTVGSQALRPAPPPPAPRDDTAWLATAANFLAHALPDRLVGARLLEQFFNSLRRRLALPEDGTPVWPWLEANARISVAEIRQLRTAHERLAAGKRIRLASLHRLVSDLTRRLQ